MTGSVYPAKALMLSSSEDIKTRSSLIGSAGHHFFVVLQSLFGADYFTVPYTLIISTRKDGQRNRVQNARMR